MNLALNRRTYLIAAAVAVVLVLGVGIAFAVGGGGDDDDPTFTDETTPDPTDETDDESDDGDDEFEDAGDDPVTPPSIGPVAPLTGIETDDEELLERAPLMVKLDNSPPARPQAGLNQADHGIELLVEGITRLALVFHSEGAEVVGPVRSGRSSDPDLAANYGTPLFAWSGGNPTVRGEVRQGEIDGKLYDVGFDQFPPDYYRDSSRGVAYEHTLFSSTDALFEHAPDEIGPPPQMFSYRYDDETHPDATESRGVEIIWRGGLPVHWVWSEDAQGWLRFQRGTPHVDTEGVQVAPPNVVLLTTPYGTSAASAGSPQALTVGEGEALVLTDGQAIEGRWTRESAADPWRLADLDGDPILLTPGHTWIGLPEDGDVTELDDEQADELLDQAA